MDPNHKLDSESDNFISNSTSFHSLIGKLIYSTHMLSEIIYVVYKLTQFLSKLTAIHQQAALKILHYIKTELTKGLFSKPKSKQKKSFSPISHLPPNVFHFTFSPQNFSLSNTHNSSPSLSFHHKYFHLKPFTSHSSSTLQQPSFFFHIFG